MMKYFLTRLLFICCAILLLAGCTKNDDVIVAPDGIEFNPVIAYQEAYPGAIVNFKFRVRSAEAVTSLKTQFQLPGTTSFVEMPEYPEMLATAAAGTSTFKDFEYSLPPSTTAMNDSIRFKFIAKTATQIFEKIYTVKILNTGLQVLRLYSPVSATYFRSQALDLLKATIVPASFSAATKDMVSFFTPTIDVSTKDTLKVLRGWVSGNTTMFKLKTKAIFDGAVATYAAQYAAGVEQNGAATLGFTSTMATLSTANNYYLAKVVRGASISYVGVFVRKLPLVSLSGLAGNGTLDVANEYLEIQIKK